jgi:hypothetical protein
MRATDLSNNSPPAHARNPVLIKSVPALQAHSTPRYDAWVTVIAEYVAHRRGCGPDDLWPQTLAFAALGTSIAAFTARARSGGDLETRIAGAYAALAAGFRF